MMYSIHLINHSDNTNENKLGSIMFYNLNKYKKAINKSQ